jgi:hypothetical protein
MENNENYTSQHREINKLMLKYVIRFREVCENLIHSGYMGVFAKQEALESITNEYLRDNPDVEPYITCKVFYIIGDLSHTMTIKSNFNHLEVKEIIERMMKNSVDETK